MGTWEDIIKFMVVTGFVFGLAFIVAYAMISYLDGPKKRR